MKKSDDWRDLEQLVAGIQKGLAPMAVVEHDKKIVGVITGRERQIDVWVTQHIGQYTMFIAIDCKDTKRPIDTKCVEEFHGLLKDLGAHKGVLVCPSGFSTTATKTAKHYMIELYRPVDTGDHKWKVRARIPVLCDFRGAKMAFGVSTCAPMPFRFSVHPAYFNTSTKDGASLGTPLETATHRWNEGKFPTEPGSHGDQLVFNEVPTFVDNGYGDKIPVTLTVSLEVEQRLFFGELPIDQISGFFDELTGNVVTNSFKTGKLDLWTVERNWKRIESADDLPILPVLKLQALDCW